MVDETFKVDPDDAGYLAVALALLREVCDDAKAEFFVVGAAARDLLLEHVYGVRPFRSTTDVDIAVAVESWPEYEGLIGRLVKRHGFERANVEHRVERPGLVVDVVPYGEVAGDGVTIQWPESDRTMSVLGYTEAFEASVQVRVGDALPVRVASLPGVVLLKLIAWDEAPHRRRQDPIDVCAIMMGYEHVVGESLYTDHGDLLEDLHDVRVAGARILGRDVAKLLQGPLLRERVLGLLRRQTGDENGSRFVQAMRSECHRDFGYRLLCLKALQQGVEERAPTL